MTQSLSQRATAAIKKPPQKATHPNPKTHPRSQAYPPVIQNLRRPDFFNTEAYRKQKYRANWTGVDVDLRAWCNAFLRELDMYGIPAFAHNAMRTDAEQLALFKKGVSKISGRGAHGNGQAVDIIHSTLAWDGMTSKDWKLFGDMGKDIAARRNFRLTWGGDFRSFYDPAHWEITDWRNRKPKLL